MNALVICTSFCDDNVLEPLGLWGLVVLFCWLASH
jgi:hypothetical protein